MRIIHEIDGLATTSIGSSCYGKAKNQTKASGFKVSALILVEETLMTSGEELHIEGNAKYVLKALKELVEQIEESAQEYIEDGSLDPNWNKD